MGSALFLKVSPWVWCQSCGKFVFELLLGQKAARDVSLSGQSQEANSYGLLTEPEVVKVEIRHPGSPFMDLQSLSLQPSAMIGTSKLDLDTSSKKPGIQMAW